MTRSIPVFLLAICSAVSAWAATPVDVYHFDTQEQEARYKALIEEFRCPKCLNTNLAGSDAPIAQDMRRTVHDLVVGEGFSDQQVRDYLRERYGDFVLYDPPFEPRTYAIWLVPIGLGLLGMVAIFLLVSRARQPAEHSLDAADRKRIEALLQDD